MERFHFRLARRITLTPAQILVLGFAVVILTGGLLLTLPVSARSGQLTPFLDALFTATSATCVTGLVVVDTGKHFSLFGQLVILLLIQVGGLGIMTMATLYALVIGKRITLRERLLIQESLGQFQMAGVVRLTRAIILITLATESLGSLILFLRFLSDYPPLKAFYFAVFHTVSAFNNAGFDLFGTSLMGYVGDPVVILTISGLIIAGGLGFTVIYELLSLARGRHGLSLHSKVVLKVTGLLLLFGTVLILLFEFRNPETLAYLDWKAKLLGAFFHAVTPRTAGFNSLPTGQLTQATLFLTILLMFIGGSPAGTAGGIKTSTFATILGAVWMIIRGKHDLEFFGRRLPNEIVAKALVLMILAMFLVGTVVMVLLLAEDWPFLDLAFETVSAFGTVGLSTGVTPTLSPIGKVAIILTMFAGRVGPLTLAMALAAQRTQQVASIRLPEERILIG